MKDGRLKEVCVWVRPSYVCEDFTELNVDAKLADGRRVSYAKSVPQSAFDSLFDLLFDEAKEAIRREGREA